jgi:hypothetical protein
MRGWSGSGGGCAGWQARPRLRLRLRLRGGGTGEVVVIAEDRRAVSLG